MVGDRVLIHSVRQCRGGRRPEMGCGSRLISLDLCFDVQKGDPRIDKEPERQAIPIQVATHRPGLVNAILRLAWLASYQLAQWYALYAVSSFSWFRVTIVRLDRHLYWACCPLVSGSIWKP